MHTGCPCFAELFFSPHGVRQHTVRFFTIQMHLGVFFGGSSGLRTVKWPNPKQCPLLLTPHKRCSWVAIAVHLMHGMPDQERGICIASVSGIFWGEHQAGISWHMKLMVTD